MAIISCNLDPSTFLVWKYSDENPTFGSQVIVSQTQQAILLASGKLVDILQPGAHTLETANIPVLKDFIQDNEKAFPFEIWFLNKIALTDFKWGTTTPISVFDPQTKLIFTRPALLQTVVRAVPGMMWDHLLLWGISI